MKNNKTIASSSPASHRLKGQDTEHTTVKCPVSYKSVHLATPALSCAKNDTKTYSKILPSLRKQTTFHDATTDFSIKWGLRNERRNSIPIWVMTYHHYRISKLVHQSSFPAKITGDAMKCLIAFCMLMTPLFSTLYMTQSLLRENLMMIFLRSKTGLGSGLLLSTPRRLNVWPSQ